jgi:hypothetical protein
LKNNINEQQLTLGFAKLGQKQYPSALVRYLASARAEVFQCSFLFLSSSVFQLGSGSGRKIFKFPNIAKPYRYAQCQSDTLLTMDGTKEHKIIYLFLTNRNLIRYEASN